MQSKILIDITTNRFDVSGKQVAEPEEKPQRYEMRSSEKEDLLITQENL